jgi:thioredoxin-disulfide reductase
MYDIIIAGAGTAGLSAAVYGARAGKRVLVLEKEVYGGQIMSASVVENYPGIRKISGYEFAQGLYEQAMEQGAEIKYEKVQKIQDSESYKTVHTSLSAYDSRTVILASGAKNRHLQVAREEELTGKGISYCATCDGAFYRGKDVAVVGGGNTALEDALFLSGYCRKVYLIHRRDQFRGEKRLQDSLREKEHVIWVLESHVAALNGTGYLESVTIEQEPDKGRKELAVSALFIAIGQEPDNQPFASLVELDAHGYIRAAEDCRTSAEGIFAAGDCRTKTVRQLTTAAADGAAAALAACAYIG